MQSEKSLSSSCLAPYVRTLHWCFIDFCSINAFCEEFLVIFFFVILKGGHTLELLSSVPSISYRLVRFDLSVFEGDDSARIFRDVRLMGYKHQSYSLFSIQSLKDL